MRESLAFKNQQTQDLFITVKITSTPAKKYQSIAELFVTNLSGVDDASGEHGEDESDWDGLHCGAGLVCLWATGETFHLVTTFYIWNLLILWLEQTNKKLGFFGMEASMEKLSVAMSSMILDSLITMTCSQKAEFVFKFKQGGVFSLTLLNICTASEVWIPSPTIIFSDQDESK